MLLALVLISFATARRGFDYHDQYMISIINSEFIRVPIFLSTICLEYWDGVLLQFCPSIFLQNNKHVLSFVCLLCCAFSSKLLDTVLPHFFVAYISVHVKSGWEIQI